MNEEYNICMEVSGKTAIWTRPDTGATPVSYPIPLYRLPIHEPKKGVKLGDTFG
jgi:hypothetical protein